MLLHESGLLPALYVPVADVRTDLLTKARAHDALSVQGRCVLLDHRRQRTSTSQNAVWGYETPVESAAFIHGYMALYWDRVDQWHDEDEEVLGHLCVTPITASTSARPAEPVTASIDGRRGRRNDCRLSCSLRPGLPNRYYIPEADVRAELCYDLESHSLTHCPYKGDASYRSLAGTASRQLRSRGSTPTRSTSQRRIAGHWSFDGDRVTIAG